jgi:hypothetical protein
VATFFFFFFFLPFGKTGRKIKTSLQTFSWETVYICKSFLKKITKEKYSFLKLENITL